MLTSKDTVSILLVFINLTHPHTNSAIVLYSEPQFCMSQCLVKTFNRVNNCFEKQNDGKVGVWINKNMSKQKPKKNRKAVKKIISKTIQSDYKIVPLGSRLLIRPFTREELMSKNNFGIILPESDSKEKSEQGIVLAVGPGEYHHGQFIKTTVKVGEKVVFSKYGYEDVNVDGEELYLIKEENILATLK